MVGLARALLLAAGGLAVYMAARARRSRPQSSASSPDSMAPRGPDGIHAPQTRMADEPEHFRSRELDRPGDMFFDKVDEASDQSFPASDSPGYR